MFPDKEKSTKTCKGEPFSGGYFASGRNTY